ncbi:MAG: hypothetical protein KF795_23640 [Labilithrix sp.]|nr:hypothetical protein [Labilithrix sp.]MBX3223526.1 hypothetical protein [Labilithrix sp.]
MRLRAIQAAMTLAPLAIVTACGTLLGVEDGEPLPSRIDGGEAAEGDVDASADVASGDADAGADAARHKVVFVTETRHTGAFGGRAGADAICDDEAKRNDLAGTFVAYVHVGGGAVGHPALRLADGGGASWMRVDGHLAFEDNPMNVAPKAALELTADGGLVPAGDLVWTGIYNGPGGFCGTVSDPWSMTVLDGAFGDPHAVTAAWQQTTGLRPCTTEHRLYCFQQ